MRLLLFLAAAAAAQGQVTIEDYKCLAATPTSGNPTVLRCNEPHGFDNMYAQAVALFDNSVTDGTTVGIGGVIYTLRTTIDNAAPGQVLIGANGTATAQNFYDAVNDSGNGKGTTYSAATTAHPAVVVGGVNNYQAYVIAQAPGVAGMSIPVTSSNSNRVSWATVDQRRALSSLAIQWFVLLSGASGDWVALVNNGLGGAWNAVYVSPTEFSIGLNSRSFGPAAPVTVRRASGSGSPLQYVNSDIAPLETDAVRPGFYTITSPACPSPLTDEAGCTAGYTSPDNQKGYYNAGGVTIESFAVDMDGIATITLSGLFKDAATYPSLSAGQLVFLRGVTGVATMSAGSYRGYTVRSLTTTASGKKTQLTIATTLAAGTYATANGTVRTTWPSSPNWWIQPRLTGGYVWPIGFVWFQAKNPAAMNPKSNRYRMWIKWGNNVAYDPVSAIDTINWGTYPVGGYGTQVHFYHLLTSNTYAGQWQKYEWTAAPDHQVGSDPSIVWPNDPINGPGHPFQSYWRGGPRNYMMAQTSSYIDTYGAGLNHSGETLVMSPAQFDYAANEPEELVRSRTILYSPKRFLNGALSANPGYEVSWASLPRTGYTYEVRMSTQGSLKQIGFSRGLCHNGTTACDASDIVTPLRSPTYIPCLWQSSTVNGQAPNVWVGIRPTAPVFGMSGAGDSPIWVITEADYGMEAGDHVTVQGVGGNTAANQTAVITAAQPRQVWFLHSPNPQGDPTWTLPGALTGIAAQGGICTATLNQPHSLARGWKVLVTGGTNDRLGGASWKNYTVTAVPSAASFAFACPGVPDGAYAQDGGGGLHLVIMSYPGFSIAGTGSGDWDGASGKVTAADDYKNFAEIQLSPYVDRPTRTSPFRPRVGSANSGQAMLHYTAPDSRPCTAAVTDQTNFTRDFADGGGLRSRSLLVSGLTSSSAYTYSIDCADGAGGDGHFDTAAAGSAASRAVPVLASRPPQSGADRLVIDYGASPSSLTNTTGVVCSGGPCPASIQAPGDSVVWLRRRWCRNGTADAACANAANEVSRSGIEPVVIR